MERKIEIYPMPMFPTLSVADVRTSVEWYADTLGFALVFAMPGTDGETVLAHLRWRKYADLLLVPDARGPQAARPKGLGVALSFLAGPTSVDDMFAGLAAKGVELTDGPVNRPWNTREIVVPDPDGYRLIFFEPVDLTKTFEEVMDSTAKSSWGRGTPPRASGD